VGSISLSPPVQFFFLFFRFAPASAQFVSLLSKFLPKIEISEKCETKPSQNEENGKQSVKMDDRLSKMREKSEKRR
jgi:hypothetical protein